MIPLAWFVLAVLGGAAIYHSTKKKFEPTEESDCSEEFLAFEQRLSITATKRKQLIASRNSIQKKIRDYFKDKPNMPIPTFYIQGSYKQNTVIRKQDDTCDMDIGIYFEKKPLINPDSIQKNVVLAIGSHTGEEPTIKSKCVRIYFANKYHLDFPIYYYDADKFYIGIGGTGWREDDPKLFTNWLFENIKDNYQKIRVIKYFKAWSDAVKTKQGQKMPSGLALTVWAMDNFQEDDREDLSFMKTAMAIYNHLSELEVWDWECEMPTTPNDSVIEKLNEEQRVNFLNNLETLITQCKEIVESNSKEECLLTWKSIFGRWFPI